MGEGAVESGLERQLQVVPKREQLTEAEARSVGYAAQRLARYRFLLTKADDGGSLNATPKATAPYRYGGGQTHGVNLTSTDLKAALALLIEREELFLASFNVKIERTE